MKLKVLILDDEPIIREGLMSFPWKEYDCQVVGSAEDGEEGLVMVKLFHPDIILSDIKMPGMNGLVFAEKVKELAPETEIIFLTGYDSFDFAQQAIRLKIKDYLLKPIKYNEMENLIAKVSKEIVAHRVYLQNIENLQEQYEKALPMIRSRLTYELLHGKIYSRKDLQNKLNLFSLNIEKYIVITGQIHEEVKENRSMNPYIIELGISNICEEVFSKYCEKVLIDVDHEGWHCVLIFAKKVLNKDLILACTRACEKIQVEIQKYIQTGFKFGSSSIETDPYNMALCLEQSLNVLSLSIVLEKMEISFFDDLYGSSNSKIWYFPKEKQSLLVRTAISGDSATALNLVDEFFQKCPRESESSLSYIRMQVLELLVNAIKQLEIINDYQEESKIMRKAIDQVWTYDTVDEIEKFLKRVFSTFAKNRIRHYQSRVQNTVELLIDYIQYHYKEDLSLDLLSEQFHLSNSYISRLISNYTGKSFGENLLKIRMKKAKQFLEKNQLKISEIAENLGYHDTSYFIQVFKKYFGITPSEYRKQYK